MLLLVALVAISLRASQVWWEGGAVAALRPYATRFGYETRGTNWLRSAIGDTYLTRVTDLSFGSKGVTDRGMAYAGRLSELRTLDLHGGSLTDAGLRSIRRLRKLESLSLGANRSISDDGMAHLAGLSRLRTLNLTYTRITGEGLRHLRGLRNLESLDLSDTGITGNELQHLRGLPNLKSLNLTRTRVDDRGLAVLESLPRLRNVKLFGSKVSLAAAQSLFQKIQQLDPEGALVEAFRSVLLAQLDPDGRLTKLTIDESRTCADAFEHVGKLPTLRAVFFGRRVSDEELWQLVGATNLEEVHFQRPRITPALASLAQMPNLRELRLDDVDDAHLPYVKAIPRLERLTIQDSPNASFTDAGMRPIGEMRTLRRLTMWNIAITDEGVAHLKDVPLEELHLGTSLVTTECLRHLAAIATLQRLEVPSNALQAKAAHAVALPSGLRHLGLWQRAAVDIDLEPLAALPHLESLELEAVPMTDALIAQLGRLKHLRKLVVRSLAGWMSYPTEVASEQRRNLHTALPNTEIEFPR